MSATVEAFLVEVRRRLMPSKGYSESAQSYVLLCPSGKCGDNATFILSRINGSGLCLNEPLPTVGGYRCYSPREIAELLGMDVYGLYGLFAGPSPVNLADTDSAMAGDSLRGLRVDCTDTEKVAQALLEDPRILQRFLWLAEASGIAGEGGLLQTLYLVVTSRLLGQDRIHSSLGGESGAGKSEVARFVLGTLPPSTVMHLGGGASKRALQYSGDLSRQVVFIDEADTLDEDLRALLREAVTRPEVTRLVTEGEPSSGFKARRYTVKTEGMVLIQGGTKVIANPADETRMLVLYPDVSETQTCRILDKQAEQAATFSSSLAYELGVWRKAQELLKPCIVIIPYARELRQFFTSDAIRVRRDFPRVLSLIRAHACLYQCQRSCDEQDERLIVVADFEDYRCIYQFARSLFTQATKRLTPTQEKVTKLLRQHVDLDNPFTTRLAEQWAGQAYTTIRGHLQALESLGVAESAPYRGQRLWTLVADAPLGLTLPTPEQLANALHPQTPQTVPTQSYAKAERFTGSVPVTDPQTPQTPSPRPDTGEVKRWTL